MSILAKRDAAVLERDQASSAKKEALARPDPRCFYSFLPLLAVAAREEALQQRYKALTERDKALIEKDDAFAALQHHVKSLNFALSGEKCCEGDDDWYCNDVGLIFDARRTMQVLVCTCTYSLHISVTNGGNGGWQSSCCTTTLSQHPLPQVPNKRHSRVGGKKMSGNVFSRLLSCLVAEMI
ncbi:unnamed protein product [Brassica oleracea]